MIIPNERGGDFNAMQNSMTGRMDGKHQLQVFDLLYIDGYDLRQCRLIDRKAVLEELLSEAPDFVQIVERIEGADSARVYESACALGLEGIVAKVMEGPYRSGDKTDGVKVKCVEREKFVVVGFVPQPGGSVAALRLARRDGQGLVYAGKVGTGFSAKSGAEMCERSWSP
jgi:bifunctional non-homologous end joining protein LigD